METIDAYQSVCFEYGRVDGGATNAHNFQQTKEEFIEMLSPTPPAASGYEVRGVEQRGPDAIVDDYAALTKNPLARSLILFDFDSNAIKPESYPILKNLADALQNELREVVLVMAGHTDSTGAEAYNLGLSQRRATAVQEFLSAALVHDKKSSPPLAGQGCDVLGFAL